MFLSPDIGLAYDPPAPQEGIIVEVGRGDKRFKVKGLTEGGRSWWYDDGAVEAASGNMDDRSIPSLFRTLVGYPIAEILNGKHVIILIDSIDEGVPRSDSDSRPRTELSWENDILRLLCSHLMQLPGQNVSLVVTGLPDSGQDTYISQMIQSAVQRHRISMTCLDIRDFQPPDQMAFLQSALSPTQPQLASILPEDALQALFAAGHGSLLHLRLVAAACQVSKEAPSVDSLPRTLPEAYQYYLQALPAPSCGWPAAVEVLEVLVAAREPPSLAMLEQCGLQHAAEVVRALGLLLRVTDVGQVYALHGTTLDFFTDREAAGALYADPARGHQRLCKALLVELERGAGDASLYCLGNLVKHAHFGGDEAAVDRVVGDIDFLQRCFEVGVGEAVFRDIVQMRGRESGVVYDAVMFLRQNLADLVREPQRAVELARSTPPGCHFARANKKLTSLTMDSDSEHAVLMEKFSLHGKTVTSNAHWPKQQWIVRLPDYCARQLAVTPDGTKAILGLWNGKDAQTCFDATVKVLDVETGAELLMAMDGFHAHSISFVAISRDGNLLATGSRDNYLKLWDVGTCRQVAALQGHTELPRSAAFSPDSTKLASCAQDGTVRLYSLNAKANMLSAANTVQQPLRNEDGYPMTWGIGTRCQDTLYCGRFLGQDAIPGSDGYCGPTNGPQCQACKVFQPKDESQVKALRTADSLGIELICDSDLKNPLLTLAFSLGGDCIVVGCDNGNILVLDSTTLVQSETVMSGHSKRVWQLAFSPCGNMIASASEDATVRVWEFPSGTVRDVFSGHDGPVHSVTFTPDRQMLVSGGANAVCLWNLSTASQCGRIGGFKDDAVLSVAATHGKVLFSGHDLTVRCVGVKECLKEYKHSQAHGDAGLESSLEINHDGTAVSILGQNGNLRIQEVPSGVPLYHGARQQKVVSMSYTRQCNKLISSCNDRTLVLWDTLSELRPHKRRFTATDSFQETENTEDAGLSLAFRSDSPHDLERMFLAGATYHDMIQQAGALTCFSLDLFYNWIATQQKVCAELSHPGLLWITGDQGTGKSALSMAIFGQATSEIPKGKPHAEREDAPADNVKVIALFLKQSDSRCQDAVAAIVALGEQLRKVFEAEMAGYDPRKQEIQQAQPSASLANGDKVVLTNDYKDHGDADEGPLKPRQVWYAQPPHDMVQDAVVTCLGRHACYHPRHKLTFKRVRSNKTIMNIDPPHPLPPVSRRASLLKLERMKRGSKSHPLMEANPGGMTLVLSKTSRNRHRYRRIACHPS